MICPSCKEEINKWYVALINWPFYTTCSACSKKLRIGMSIRHNLIIQLLAQIIFWAITLSLLSHNLFLAIILGSTISLSIVLFAVNKLAHLKCVP